MRLYIPLTEEYGRHFAMFYVHATLLCVRITLASAMPLRVAIDGLGVVYFVDNTATYPHLAMLFAFSVK